MLKLDSRGRLLRLYGFLASCPPSFLLVVLSELSVFFSVCGGSFPLLLSCHAPFDLFLCITGGWFINFSTHLGGRPGQDLFSPYQ